MKRKILAILLATVVLFQGTDTSVHAEGSGRTVPHYNITEVGGNWDGIHYTLTDGTLVTDAFFFDGTYTYYLQADGTPMRNKLTYHPDGEHIIYLDADGHEVFGVFQYCPSVGYTCYFDSNGYLYKDQITFVGDKVYYLNANGAMEQNGWFQFANGADYGYANWDGSLKNNGFSYDPWGRIVFYHWNGMVARGLITDGIVYYSMDTTDGHLLGSFPVESVTQTPVPQPVHEHTWKPVVRRGWDEENGPIMEYDTFCMTCYRRGEIVRLHGQEEVNQHCIYHYYIGDSSCQWASMSLQVGTGWVHHDEVLLYFLCPECGETKELEGSASWSLDDIIYVD